MASALNGGALYAVDSDGWVTKILADIRASKPCGILVSGPIILDVVKHVQEQAAIVSKLPAVQEGISSLISHFSLPNVPAVFEPMALAGSLAALGAIGGVVGSVAVVAGMAHSHGMTVAAVVVAPSDILNVAAVEVHIEFILGKV